MQWDTVLKLLSLHQILHCGTAKNLILTWGTVYCIEVEMIDTCRLGLIDMQLCYSEVWIELKSTRLLNPDIQSFVTIQFTRLEVWRACNFWDTIRLFEVSTRLLNPDIQSFVTIQFTRLEVWRACNFWDTIRLFEVWRRWVLLCFGQSIEAQ